MTWTTLSCQHLQRISVTRPPSLLTCWIHPYLWWPGWKWVDILVYQYLWWPGWRKVLTHWVFPYLWWPCSRWVLICCYIHTCVARLKMVVDLLSTSRPFVAMLKVCLDLLLHPYLWCQAKHGCWCAGYVYIFGGQAKGESWSVDRLIPVVPG